MKGSLMKLVLGAAMSMMSRALEFPAESKERSVYELQAHKLSAGCCYANPEQGQFFATKGRGHKLKGWKRIQCGLTKKRK